MTTGQLYSVRQHSRMKGRTVSNLRQPYNQTRRRTTSDVISEVTKKRSNTKEFSIYININNLNFTLSDYTDLPKLSSYH